MAKLRKKSNSNGANLGFVENLWAAADKLRGHMDAAEYKHVVLGIVFLKYISDAFSEHFDFLRNATADKTSDWFVKEPEDRYSVMEDRDEYIAANVFWVPEPARWEKLQANVNSLVDRTHREMSEDEIARIAKTSHAWRGEKEAGKYEDIAGFCKSASMEEITGHGHVLTPGRYVGAEETEDDDDMPFDERMEQLTAKLKGQFAESAKLEKAILKNLASLGFTGMESS